MFGSRSFGLSIWLRDTVEALKAAFHDRAIRYAVLALLLVDATVLCIYVAWSFANTFDLRDSYFYGKNVFSTADWGLIETAGYIKELAGGAMIVWIAVKVRSALFAALALVFGLMLTGDSLRMHELLADSLVVAGVPFSVSELVAMVIIGAIPAVVLAVAWLRAAEEHRRAARPVLVGIALVMSFAVALDSFKHLFPPADYEKVAALVEDGGELLSLTILVAIVATVFRGLSASPNGRDRIGHQSASTSRTSAD
jgi:hypothetical protein